MRKKLLAIVLTLVILAGCAPAAAEPTIPSVPPLTVDEVKDAEIHLTTLTGDVPIAYQLKDGVYQKGTDPAGASYALIRLLDQTAFGDLNGDGVGDAAALVAENYGGTGVFVSLVAFVNQAGVPVQAAVTPIDDRPAIQSLDLQNGEIGLEATIHAQQDPMCCPALATKRHYRLSGSRLLLVDFSTQVVAGQWRTITITNPDQAAAAAGKVEISGTVTIAPFENNLSYHIMDEKGNELASGPVPVAAMDMGAPGTFKVQVALDHVAPGTTAWIEIRDLSAADGSLLAMDSIPVR
jgi:hypothetical protein